MTQRMAFPAAARLEEVARLRLEASRMSETVAPRVAQHVRMGEQDGDFLRAALNEALWALTAALWGKCHDQSSGVFQDHQEEDVKDMAGSCATALRRIGKSAAKAVKDDNEATAKLLENVWSAGSRPTVRLEVIKAMVRNGRYDLAISRTLVYLPESFRQLQLSNSQEAALARAPEFMEAADALSEALDNRSSRTNDPVMAGLDRFTADGVWLFGASTLKRR